MKAKKIILLLISLTVHSAHAGIVHHTLTSTTEQRIMGQNFKHTMTSGGPEKDEFFIDGYAVSKEIYHHELDLKQKKERELEALRQENARRNRLQFSDMVYLEITAKLLNKILSEVTQLLVRIQNPTLEKFFIFTDKSIESPEQLTQLKHFIEQIQQIIEKKIVNNDAESLNILYTKLECWPARLETFFQDTVQNAIKKSDDTTMLKELLKLVSESSLMN